MMALVAARGPPPRAHRGRRPLAAVERARESLKMWFAIDTLEYLRKGGRIGAAQAWLGSALQIKPILTLEEEITPVERVRTRRRAFERMVEFARERQRRPAPAPGSSSTSTTPTRRGGWSTSAARSSAPTRSSSPRSAR